MIEKAWNEEVRGSNFVKLYKKQAITRDALRKWNKEVFGNYQSRINSLWIMTYLKLLRNLSY